MVVLYERNYGKRPGDDSVLIVPLAAYYLSFSFLSRPLIRADRAKCWGSPLHAFPNITYVSLTCRATDTKTNDKFAISYSVMNVNNLNANFRRLAIDVRAHRKDNKCKCTQSTRVRELRYVITSTLVAYRRFKYSKFNA